MIPFISKHHSTFSAVTASLAWSFPEHGHDVREKENRGRRPQSALGGWLPICYLGFLHTWRIPPQWREPPSTGRRSQERVRAFCCKCYSIIPFFMNYCPWITCIGKTISDYGKSRCLEAISDLMNSSLFVVSCIFGRLFKWVINIVKFRITLWVWSGNNTMFTEEGWV